MDFLYPKFRQPTHKIINSIGISKEYPRLRSFERKQDINIQIGTNISVIQENIGFQCIWAKVIPTGQEDLSLAFYILQSNLQNIGGKSTYTPICNSVNNININEPEIDPTTKEIFVPYIDRRNGLYSVRIQTDYQKVLDSIVFENLLYDVYYEGISLLLASRGYKADNEYIDSLIGKYYTFGYINNDLDLTINRFCEPLTFTVSIPLNFFNEKEITEKAKNTVTTAEIKLQFSNRDIKTSISQIINMLLSRTSDVEALLYPNKFIENFVVDFEVNSLRTFIVSLNEVLSIAGYPINSPNELDYEFGLDKDFNLVYIKIDTQEDVIYLNQAILANARLRSEFNNKRIFYYLINIKEMLERVRTANIKDFIFRFVRYPEPKIVVQKIKIGDLEIPPEKVAEYKQAFNKNAEECVSIKGIADLSAAGADLTNTLLSDPIYHLFVKKQEDTKKPKTPLELLREQSQNLKENTQGAIQQPINSRDFDNYNAISFGVTTGFSDALQNIKDRRLNLNTVIYCLNRINLNDELFKSLFCALLGADPNSKEIARILAELPADIVNYYNYYKSIKSLEGADLVKALSTGVVPDIKFLCSKNFGLAYFVKGLTAFVKALNATGRLIVKFKTETIKKPINNPWIAFSRSTINSIEQITVGIILDLLSELLANQCQEPVLSNNNTNNTDPFNTHAPNDRFNFGENNNKQKLTQNRNDVVSKIYAAEEVQFGFDREYVVDLIGQLLNDINCILTPGESISLLLGTPEEVTKVLVKNIIRAKYSSAPNDLSFLLRDDNKLKQFFLELGLTVDPEYLIIPNLYSITQNELEPSKLCSDEQLKARTTLLDGKIPKNLGILERNLDRRKKAAQKLFDRIKDGEIEVDIAPLCPDITDNELTSANDDIVKNYIEAVRKSFTSALTNFTTEANNLPRTLAEPRIDNSNPPKEYITFNRDLAINLGNNVYKAIDGEQAYALDFNNQDLDRFSNPEAFIFPSDNVDPTVCLDKDLTSLSALFERKDVTVYIDRIDKSIVLSSAYIDDFIAKSEEALNKWVNSYNNYDTDKLKTRFAIFICNGTYGGFDDRVWFFLYKKQNDKYQLVAEQKYQGNIKENYTTDNFSDDLDKTLNNSNADSLIGKPLNISGLFDEEVYRLDSRFFNLTDNVKNIFKSVYEQKFLDKLGTSYENTTSDLFNKFGSTYLFTNKTIFVDDKNIKKQILLTKSKIDESNLDSTKPINNLEFYDEEYVSFEAKFDKNINYEIIKNIISSLQPHKIFLLGGEDYKLTKILDLPDNVKFDSLQEDIFGTTKKNDYLKKEPNIFEKNESEEKFKKNYTGITDKFLANYIKLTAFDYPLTKKFKKCNIYPHYLNLDYLLNLAAEIKKADLCDINNYTPYDIMSIVLVELTIRTYVTDLLIKAAPFISRFTQEQQINFYKDKIYIEIIKSFAKKDFETFSAEANLDNPNFYFDNIRKLAKKVYNLYKKENKIKEVFNIKIGEDEIDYFIKKEIYRFFKYSIENNFIISVLDNDISYESFLDSFINYVVSITDAVEQAVQPLEKSKKEYEEKIQEIEKQVLEINREARQLEEDIVNKYGVDPNFVIRASNYYKYEAYGFIDRRILQLNNEIQANGGQFYSFPLEDDGKGHFRYVIPEDLFIYYYTETAKTSGTEEERKIRIQNNLNIMIGIANAYNKIASNYDVLLETGQEIANINILLEPLNKDIELKTEIFKKIPKIKGIEDTVKNILILEYKFLLSYVLTASTIDFTKRTIFYSTKSELSQLFFSNVEKLINDETTKNISSTIQKKTTPDIVNYINNLAYSPSPGMLLSTEPQYAKYIKYAIDALLTSTRDILSTIAESSDLKIALAKKYNLLATIPTSILFGQLEQNTKNALIVNDPIPTKPFKRLSDGRSIQPDAVMFAAALATPPFLPPTALGISYLIVDSIQEGIYYNKAYKEIRELSGLIQPIGILEPCQVTSKEKVEAIKSDEKCTTDTRIELKNKINDLESLNVVSLPKITRTQARADIADEQERREEAQARRVEEAREGRGISDRQRAEQEGRNSTRTSSSRVGETTSNSRENNRGRESDDL